jgi:mono/diheme cytochrome c family protein
MKTAPPLSIFLALNCLLVSCESTNFAPPPVTSQMAIIGAQQHVRHGTNPSDSPPDESVQSADWRMHAVTLREGRALFVSRCIECHTLPVVSRYRAAVWPTLVDKMSGRANLKPAERESLVAYLLAARASL